MILSVKTVDFYDLSCLVGLLTCNLAFRVVYTKDLFVKCTRPSVGNSWHNTAASQTPCRFICYNKYDILFYWMKSWKVAITTEKLFPLPHPQVNPKTGKRQGTILHFSDLMFLDSSTTTIKSFLTLLPVWNSRGLSFTSIKFRHFNLILDVDSSAIIDCYSLIFLTIFYPHVSWEKE